MTAREREKGGDVVKKSASVFRDEVKGERTKKKKKKKKKKGGREDEYKGEGKGGRKNSNNLEDFPIPGKRSSGLKEESKNAV